MGLLTITGKSVRTVCESPFLMLTRFSSPHNPLFTPNFGGHAARPIKALYLQPDDHIYNREVAEHLGQIGREEGFGVFLQLGSQLLRDPMELIFEKKWGYWRIQDANASSWAQDCKIVTETEVLGLPRLSFKPGDQGILNERREQVYAKQLAKALGLPFRQLRCYVEGGNVFLGKRESGEPYVMLGEESVKITARLLAKQSRGTVFKFIGYYAGLAYEALNGTLQSALGRARTYWREKALETIVEDFRIRPENLVLLPQPEFHIDMAVRPLNGRYVLVNDFEESLAMLETLGRHHWEEGPIFQNPAIEMGALHDTLRRYRKEVTRQGYAGTEAVCKALKAGGFEPIRVPGILGAVVPGIRRKKSRPLNYTNAIVHQRGNGGLVYITNGSGIPELNQLFKEALMRKAPQVKRVEFVTGPINQESISYIERCLRNDGGIHCMSAEHPAS